MVRKEGRCYYARFITAVFKPGNDGDLILCYAGSVPVTERERGSFYLSWVSFDARCAA